MPRQLRETPLTGRTKQGDILTEQEELFCQTYVLELGNGKRAAEEAYNVDKSKSGWTNTCASIAKENLRKPHLLRRIREILDLTQLNDEKVDSELNFVISQSDDLSAKRGGIDIYNKLKARYEEHNKQKQPIIQLTKYVPGKRGKNHDTV